MLTLTFSRLLTPSQNRLINVAALGTPAIENLRSTSFTPRRITPPSVFANELYDSHRESGNPPNASLHSVWATSHCFTIRSICLAVSFTKMSISHPFAESKWGFRKLKFCARWECGCAVCRAAAWKAAFPVRRLAGDGSPHPAAATERGPPAGSLNVSCVPRLTSARARPLRQRRPCARHVIYCDM